MNEEGALTKIENMHFGNMDSKIKRIANNHGLKYAIELAACISVHNGHHLKNYRDEQRIEGLGKLSILLIADALKEHDTPLGSVDYKALRKSIETLGDKKDGIKKFVR